MGSLVTCIQVDADAYEHSPERKAVSSSYFQMQQEVVIQDTVIDALTGGLFAVYLPDLYPAGQTGWTVFPFPAMMVYVF